MSDKEIGKTTLFDKDDINVYDTVTLNTENLIDAAQKVNQMDDYDLTLDDFEQYKEKDQESENVKKEMQEKSQPNNQADYDTLRTEDIIALQETNISDTLDTLDENFVKVSATKEPEFESDDFINAENFERDVIDKVNFGKVKIMAIGIGGCGCNAIDRMQEEGITNIEIVAVDTSSQTLDNTRADQKILIGERLLGGHGSGNDIDLAKEAFENSKAEIQRLLEGTDMVFLTGGIGRGTGSAGLVEIGKYAREMGILTIGFATLPKVIEADIKVVEQYYELFTEAVDSNVIVENDRVSKIAYDLPINQAMKMADQMLVDGIRGISDLIVNPGKINLDYADIKTAFSNQGSCIMGIGYAEGEDLVVKAIDDSINSQLVDIKNMQTANTIIFNVCCAKNTITIKEASDATDLIYSRNASRDIQHMLFGYSYDENLNGKVKVTFIATGTGTINFDEYKNSAKASFQNDLKSNASFGDDIFTTVSGGSSSSGPDFFN